MSWSSLTRRVISVGRIVVPSTALLYPACNNQARGGLGRGSIGLVEFPKFQTEIFVEWKAPKDHLQNWSRIFRSDQNEMVRSI